MKALVLGILLLSLPALCWGDDGPTQPLHFLWDAPTQFEGGAPLDPAKDLLRYKFYRDGVLRAILDSPGVGTAPATEYVMSVKLAPGTYNFWVTAVSRYYPYESGKSNILTVVIPALPTPTPTPLRTPTVVLQSQPAEHLRLYPTPTPVPF